MIIAVAGAYSADTEEERQRNLNALNETAALLLEKRAYSINRRKCRAAGSSQNKLRKQL
jgi:hypothetical protein